MNEDNPVGPIPIPTIAERVGRLVHSLLSPPSLGSIGGSSTMEDAAIDRWRARLGEEAAELWGEAIGRDPEAVRLVELVQYRAGFVPGSARAIRSNDETRGKYRRELPRIFA